MVYMYLVMHCWVYSGDWIFDDLEDKMMDTFDRLPEGLL